MSQRGLRDTLRAIVPKWMTWRPLYQVGFKTLFAVVAILDIWLELALEGVWASWPGYTLGLATGGLDASTALQYIGLGRGILRGEAETDASYARRLIPWIDDWEGAGSSQVIAEQVQDYLANKPTVRIVDRAGNWVTRYSDGTVEVLPAGSAAWAWDWDETSNPERNTVDAPWWSDLWIIVYPCEWPVTTGTIGGGGLAAIWGQGLDVGIGHQVGQEASNAIRSIVAQWKGAHTWIEAIVWSYDPTLFDPHTVNAGNPNGTWGNWGWDAGDGNGVQPRRNPTCRYWIPPQG